MAESPSPWSMQMVGNPESRLFGLAHVNAIAPWCYARANKTYTAFIISVELDGEVAQLEFGDFAEIFEWLKAINPVVH